MTFESVLDILKKFNPISIFLYGSQANGSVNSKSDYEIGVVFEDARVVSRKELVQNIKDKSYSIFPFKLNELKTYTIDTPFQKKIYITSLILGNAKTIFGEKIIENLQLPKITKYDLLMDVSFNLGYAISSVRTMKCGYTELANEMLFKSMFFATRDYIYYKTGEFVCGYDKIYETSKQINIPEEYMELIEWAYNIRKEKVSWIDEKFYFKNISYINKFIIESMENG